jgi:serine protease Do
LPAVSGYETAAGYAYPVDETFRRAVETLKQGREVEYGFLGVSPVDLANEELIRGLHGARVDRIVPGTPAELCGLRAGDIVVAINGTPIYDADGLVLEVGRLPVEARVRVDFVRDGRRGQVEAVLTKYPVRGRKIVSTPAPSWRGLRVDYLSAAIESGTGFYLASLPESGGVIVAEVQPGTGAWRAGLRPGFTIVRVEGAVVSSPRDFFQAVAQAGGPVRLTVRDRPGGPLSQITVEPD